MKFFQKFALTSAGVIVGLTLSCLTPAQAATFSFIYEFEIGETLFGTVDGDLLADQDTVVNLTNLSANFSAISAINLNEIPPDNPPFQRSFCMPECTLSLSGENPFVFFGTDFSGVGFGSGFLFNALSANPLVSIGPAFVVPDDFAIGGALVDAFSANRWQVEQVAESVPEPGTILGLLAITSLGITLKKKWEEEARPEALNRA